MLELRRFEDEDAPEVWELHNVALEDVGAHAGNGPWDDDLRAIRTAYLEANGEFLVGLVNGRLVAMGGVRRLSDSVAEVKRMRVHPRFQRRGFGRLVLDQLERRAGELGYRRLRLDTTNRQVGAQMLYRRAGYREVGRGRLAGFDVIFLEKLVFREMPRDNGVVLEVLSSSGYAETLDRLLAAIAGRGLTVFAQIDHAAAAREVDLELADEAVVVFGNPRAGTPLMQEDPRVGIELPLRVLIWDRGDAVVVGYNDPRELARSYDVSRRATTLDAMASLLGEIAAEAAG